MPRRANYIAYYHLPVERMKYKTWLFEPEFDFRPPTARDYVFSSMKVTR